MKIQESKITKTEVVVRIENYKMLLQNNFGIVYAANGVDEFQAVKESIIMQLQSAASPTETLRIMSLGRDYMEILSYEEVDHETGRLKHKQKDIF
jgi:F420-0:gamma-glutamyl ligase